MKKVTVTHQVRIFRQGQVPTNHHAPTGPYNYDVPFGCDSGDTLDNAPASFFHGTPLPLGGRGVPTLNGLGGSSGGSKVSLHQVAHNHVGLYTSQRGMM